MAAIAVRTPVLGDDLVAVAIERALLGQEVPTNLLIALAVFRERRTELVGKTIRWDRYQGTVVRWDDEEVYLINVKPAEPG